VLYDIHRHLTTLEKILYCRKCSFKTHRKKYISLLSKKEDLLKNLILLQNVWCRTRNFLTTWFISYTLVHKSKGKVFPLHATKSYRVSGSVASLTPNHSIRWRYVVSLMPWPLHFTPEDVQPSTHGRGGWVRLRASLDILEKGKSLAPTEIQMQDGPVHSLVTAPITLYCSAQVTFMDG